MADIELIHAGLPWNNPLKITVKADEYISLLVINRGLLNLLSNDYYLDLKTERINQYVLLLFGPHINDTTIHWTENGIIDTIKRFLNGELGNYIESFGLLKDTAYIIPFEIANDESTIIKNINRIQNIINNCPKNLNGYTAIFALTPVVEGLNDYNKTIGLYYVNNRENINSENYDNSINISSNGCYRPREELSIIIRNKSINLDGFYGGTVILMGNEFFVCEEKYKNGGKNLSTRLTRILLEQIQKNIDKPVNGNITIIGNGNNNNCSVVSFNNCMCDTYMWNLNVQIDTTLASTNAVSNLPYKKDLSLFVPANLTDDMVTGNIRYIVADAINTENFKETYLTFRSVLNKISGFYDGNISAVCLNRDYFTLSSSFDNIRQILFGQYEDNDESYYDSIYNGATFGFWMKLNFYEKSVNEVPVIYSTDNGGNGFYFGLEKVASLTDGEINTEQYLETTFSSKKRTDISNKWLFWTITILPKDINNLNSGIYKININYTDPTLGTNSIIPNKLLVSNDISLNMLKFNNLNYGLPLYFFGTPTTRSEANIRNILIFNKVLTNELIILLANLKLSDVYNLSLIGISQTFKNSMKGALYVYNTTAMNVIGCNLSKI